MAQGVNAWWTELRNKIEALPWPERRSVERYVDGLLATQGDYVPAAQFGDVSEEADADGTAHPGPAGLVLRSDRRDIRGGRVMSDGDWLADPTGRHELRYWDGEEWTEHVSDGGQQGTDPPAMPESEPDPTCPECGETFSTDKALTRHGKQHQREQKRTELERRVEERKAASQPDARPDVAAATAKMSVKMGAGREIRKLAGHLWDGETVNLMASGTYGGGTGLMVLTNRRLLFLLDGWRGGTSEDFPVDKVSSVQWTTSMLTGTITVFASGNKVEFVNVNKVDGKALADALRARTSGVDQDAGASAPTGQSIAQQLRELAELRDQGVLTDDEFAAQKAKLFG